MDISYVHFQTERRDPQMHRIKRIVQYCVAGAAGVIAYYAVLYGLTEYFGVWYVISAIIGFILNTGLSFVLQKLWTFQNKTNKNTKSQLVQYTTMKVLFLVSNAALLYLMVEYLHLWYIAAQMVLTVVLTVSDILGRRSKTICGSTFISTQITEEMTSVHVSNK